MWFPAGLSVSIALYGADVTDNTVIYRSVSDSVLFTADQKVQDQEAARARQPRARAYRSVNT